jgi:hypothetical protein
LWGRTDDGNCHKRARAFGNGFEQRRSFSADARRISRVLDVAARVDFSAFGQNRRADGKARIRRVSVLLRLPRRPQKPTLLRRR